MSLYTLSDRSVSGGISYDISGNMTTPTQYPSQVCQPFDNAIGQSDRIIRPSCVTTLPWPEPSRHPAASFPCSEHQAPENDQNQIYKQIIKFLKKLESLIMRLFEFDSPRRTYPVRQTTRSTGGVTSVGNVDASFAGSFDPGKSGFSKKAPVGRLSKKEGDALAAKVMTRLMKDVKLTPAQAAGVVGNLMHESGGMNPHINEGGVVGRPNGSGGYGWAQWTGERKAAFLAYAKEHKLDPGSPAANYGFLVEELRNPKREHQSLLALRKAHTPQEAARIFRVEFERAGIPHDSSRIISANTLFAAYQRSSQSKTQLV